jgi:hypothetical protein
MTHGSNKKNYEIFTPEEFIATITQHIPDKDFQMVGSTAGIQAEAEEKELRPGSSDPAMSWR